MFIHFTNNVKDSSSNVTHDAHFYTTTDINECESTPCENGGSCTDETNGYTCTCTPGWTGAECHIGMPELIVTIKC
jgi:hypothetical protein